MTRTGGRAQSSKSSRSLLHLPERQWPVADREDFARAFDQPPDVFDETGGGSRLSPRTRNAIRFGYRRWLGWLHAERPDLLTNSPERCATPETIKAFVVHLRATCAPRTVASQISKLYDALRYMYPASDWGWLRSLKARLERAGPPRGRKPIQITSQRLIDASLARLDEVDLDLAGAAGGVSRKRLQGLALRYRNSLLVAVVIFLPLRRSNLAELILGFTILRGPKIWTIRIAADEVKNSEALGGDLPLDISERVDRFVAVYRPMIHGSSSHKGLWASAKGQPAMGDALYHAFQNEVKASLGLHLTLHDTRRIGATTLAVHDPANAAAARDLLGDRSDHVFAEYYNLAAAVDASRRMARLVAGLKPR